MSALSARGERLQDFIEFSLHDQLLPGLGVK